MAQEDSDEVLTLIDENKCWTCKCDLDGSDDDGEGSPERYKCPECEDVYYSCLTCEEKDGHPSSYDWEDNDKGHFCAKCSHHFCIAHFQNADFDYSEDGDGDEWMCNKCLVEHKAKKAERKAERKPAKLKRAIQKKKKSNQKENK